MPKFIQIHGNAGAGKKTLIGRLIYEVRHLLARCFQATDDIN